GALLKHFENSEVLPAGSVAVTVMKSLGGTGTDKETLKVASLLTVVTLAEPRKDWPSPLPDGSHCVLRKKSSRNCVLAVELSVPRKVVELTCVMRPVMTGKFCRLFAPVSASPASFGVMPSKGAIPSTSRSIPSLLLNAMELAEILLLL